MLTRVTTNYKAEVRLHHEQSIQLKTQRKSNSKRQDTLQQAKEKKTIRKRTETTISDIKKLFPSTIHAVTFNGFLTKMILFVFAMQLLSILN